MKAMLFNRKLCICALVLPFLFVFGSTAGGALPPEDKLWNLKKEIQAPVEKLSAAGGAMPQQIVTMKEAKSAYETGNYSKATDMFKSILLQRGDNAQAHYYYANCLARAGNHSLARAEYFACMKYSHDQNLSNYCIQAIEALNGNAELRQKERHVDQQAQRLRSEIIADHDRRKAERQKQLDLAIRRVENKLIEDKLANPGSSKTLETKAKYDIKILQIDAEEPFKLIEDDYARRLQAFTNSHENLKGQIRSKVGASQVVPSNTTMTVRNYMNFGGNLESEPEQVKAVEAPSPGLHARAGVLKPTSPSSRSKGARPGR